MHSIKKMKDASLSKSELVMDYVVSSFEFTVEFKRVVVGTVLVATVHVT